MDCCVWEPSVAKVRRIEMDKFPSRGGTVYEAEVKAKKESGIVGRSSRMKRK
jgi:hypothetical protein